uniref:Zeaxanthin epoxidase, chloroplastic-like isoform X2 n=1 Tax=Tanacetum cinerariifolium TaxID=118510 RepID=A0A6L2KC45_TANCI|nr:zeaxanthin epoxidase, chloroplastic-like isoform X2 [Tanacetum cinerariifolium]
MQWYAFHKEAKRIIDTPEGKKVRLMELFGSWCNDDCYQLILELESITKCGYDEVKLCEIVSALKRYEHKRILRTKIVHGVTRMTSKSLSGYQPFAMANISFQISGFLLRLKYFLPNFWISFKIKFATFYDLVAHCPMIECLASKCYDNLHPRRKHSAKAFSNITFNVMKSTKICAKSRRQRRKNDLKVKSGSAIEVNQETNKGDNIKERRVRILIAGGGVGGLVLALAAKRKGFEVMVFEKDLSAVRGEGRHRGPIQLLSSALGVLVDIDKGVAKQVMDAGCVTGTRINGIADGLSEWRYKKSCSMLLEITMCLTNPKLLISLKTLVRSYGLADYAPSYIKSIGYRVFLGVNQYFVACDVGNGKMQWYAFHKEPPRLSDTSEDATNKKARLMELFGGWCRDVTTMISRTREERILRRDIYDRDMIYSWGTGRVTLLGDAAHPMQPNLGLGGCLAIQMKLPQRLRDTKINDYLGQQLCLEDIYDRDMIYSWGAGRVTLLGDAAHPMQPNLGLGGCLAIQDCHQLILELENIMKCGTNAFNSDEIASALKSFRLSFYQPFTKMGMLWLPPITFQVNELIFNSALPHFMNWMLTGN